MAVNIPNLTARAYTRLIIDLKNVLLHVTGYSSKF